MSTVLSHNLGSFALWSAAVFGGGYAAVNVYAEVWKRQYKHILTHPNVVPQDFNF